MGNSDFNKKSLRRKLLIGILKDIKEYFEIKEDIIENKSSYEFEELNDNGYPNNKDMVISKHYYMRYYDKSRF